MKDNKYAPYILGPILLLIWGIVFYKIYQAVYGTGDDFQVPNYEVLPTFEPISQDSSYVLLVDYRDPFLGKRFQYNNNSNAVTRTPEPTRATNTRRKAPATTLTKIIAPSFPTIVYQGYQIMTADTIALLKINGRFYPVARKGDVFQGVQIKEIHKDSLQLEFKGQLRYFLKNR